MNCSICKRESKEHEWFYSIDWKHVDQKEYKRRIKLKITTLLKDVCKDCYNKFMKVPPLNLTDLNEIRRRKITEKQYYKEKGYEF